MDKLKEILEEKFKDIMTEDASKEICTLFEATIKERVDEQVDKILEEKEAALEEKVSKDLVEFKSTITDKLSEYIDLSIEEFVEDNRPVIESDIKVKLAEKFIGSIKTAFTESYIDVPEDKIDVVKEYEEKIKDLKGQLNEKINKDIDLEKQILEYEKALKFQTMTEDLSDVDKEKLLDLVENIDCADIEDFEKKVNIIKESIIEKKEIKKEKKHLNEDFTDKKTGIDKYLPSKYS